MTKSPSVLLLALFAACTDSGNDTSILASGYIEATEVRIGTKVAGRLQSIEIREGDSIRKDQEIAKIDPVDYLLALETAKADREQSEADLRGARKDLQRMEDLLASGSGTMKSRDDARTRFDIASGRVNAARARLAQLAQQISDTSIRSPLSGLVTEKLMEEGELLSSGATIAVVTDVANSWLTAYVTEPDLAKIRVGGEATVETDGGNRRSGKITYVSSTAEFTPKNVQTKDERVKLVYKIKIAIDNRDFLFKPGMPAQSRIPVGPVGK
jgi:HlyD family secretion protein